MTLSQDDITIRHEQAGDEPAIDAAVTRAFSNADEANLVREVLAPSWATCEAHPSAAAMAIELVDGALAGYETALASGQRQPGVCNWPVPFVMC